MAAAWFVVDTDTAGMASAAADAATAYLVHLADRQVRVGADWLDVNVDEVAGDLDLRITAVEWISTPSPWSARWWTSTEPRTATPEG